MSSSKVSCSAFRCSVASATDLSIALIPVSTASISVESKATPSCALAMAASESESERSRTFFLSSAKSSCLPQYSFLWSSSTCSFLRFFTMPSIMAVTFSKPACLPCSAITRRSRRLRSPVHAPANLRAAPRATTKARIRCARALSPRTCTKLTLEAGKVFLKSSRASSSLRTLMVSAKAVSSSERTFTLSSHSEAFVAQPFSSSAWNFWSSSNAASVLERLFFICSIATPNSPTC
mmetsp:Transcript_36552/g.79779  ORF Transcript_36552/g.79779 Transcript_36552/m.79779 type:complete len:236 (+) Transcript_36552:774-1481(+)